MALERPSSLSYAATLDLLTRALATLDALDEGVAAAHLCSVIDLVAARLGDHSLSRH